MTNQEMKLLHERMKKEDPRLLALMEKCFDAGVLSGKEQAQRTWVGLDPEEIRKTNHHMVDGAYHYSFKQGAEWAEATLKEKNTRNGGCL